MALCKDVAMPSIIYSIQIVKQFTLVNDFLELKL
ncbi:hypothetical protein XSR1_190036 [Xenorhabdus szentirmaii DSM 16338]|uniref:Uncharacterized protein n=1 Tax=Xenorhabdus szentirmaii DSM 16338 TaxID=1427518 RepID=W1IWV5_9GAMM|nr:hypothetical protein Xsze_01704 [Xenorhabdus szentirmaii DSM 16338]CDL82101.1 hypothetical protein XSR1_190036 [Xenorhabdus szentirmaii DSM 16338]